ncbi:hypothetical protein DITRI_Ditri06bG0037900 [Diplodiscus trichospermus]
MDDEPEQSPLPTRRRRNSISTPVKGPAKLTVLTPKPLQTATSLPNGSAASPPLDLDLISLKTSFASYTSLKDILPSSAIAVNSPTAAGSATNSGNEAVEAWSFLETLEWRSHRCSRNSCGNHLEVLEECLEFAAQISAEGLVQ